MTYPKIDKPTVPGAYFARHCAVPREHGFVLINVVGYKMADGTMRMADEIEYFGIEYNTASIGDFYDWRGPLPEPTE